MAYSTPRPHPPLKTFTTGALAILCWCTLASLIVAAEPQRLITIEKTTPVFEVNAYFSLAAHGPTKKFYTVADANAVVLVSTTDGTADAQAVVYLFAESATPESLKKWLNNQHSDALYVDAAEPVRMFAVPEKHFHAESGPPLEHEVGRGGDEYDRVRVSFAVDGFSDGDSRVEAFSSSLDAFVRTRDLQ